MLLADLGRRLGELLALHYFGVADSQASHGKQEMPGIGL